MNDEIEKHRTVLREKSGLTDTDLDALFDTLFSSIELVSSKRTQRYRSRAQRAMAAIDPKDTLYVAAALTLDAAIWSNDPDLHEQTLTPALTTEAMVARVRQAQREPEDTNPGQE